MKKLILFIVLSFCGLILSLKSQASEVITLGEQAYVTDVPNSGCLASLNMAVTDLTDSFYTINEQQHVCVYVPVNLEHDLPLGTELKVSFLGSGKFYWNGVYVGKKGLPANSIAQEQAGPISTRILLSKEQLSKGSHLLSMEVSTHAHLVDFHRIMYQLALVPRGKSNNPSQLSHIAPNMLLGSLCLLSFCFLLFYLKYNREGYNLVFSLLCFISAGIIALELVKFYWAYPWNLHVYRLLLIYACVVIAGGLLILFYALFYKSGQTKLWLSGYLLLSIACGIFIQSYDLKNYAVFLLALIISLLINANAIKTHRITYVHCIALGLGLISMLDRKSVV